MVLDSVKLRMFAEQVPQDPLHCKVTVFSLHLSRLTQGSHPSELDCGFLEVSTSYTVTALSRRHFQSTAAWSVVHYPARWGFDSITRI